MNVFDAMDVYWAEIADKNQTERQIQFLKNTLKADGYMLDLACGTGRHSVALNREGYDTVGLDVSRRLLRIAKQRFKGVQVVRGDLRFLPFKPGAFAAAVSMDTSIGYLPAERDDLQSLAEAHRVLTTEGVLVVDVFNREHLARKYKESHLSDWIEYPSFFLKQRRQATADGLFDVWTIRDKTVGREVEFVHSVRLYGLEALQGLLEKAGFAVGTVFGDYDGQLFNADSPRFISLTRAR